MNLTHIEVLNDKGNPYVKTGQLLKVIPKRETPCFLWVEAHGGTPLKVSKRTHRICGMERGFFRASCQPALNF